MLQALLATLIFFIRWRLLSLRMWTAVFVGYEFHRLIGSLIAQHQVSDVTITTVGVSMLIALVIHQAGQSSKES